jgi:6-phosphogluconolactonase (cycloisomerase 2 family)
MKLASFTAAALLLASTAAFAGRAYVGSYTPDPIGKSGSNGEGIYLVDVDDATGVPSHARVAARTPSPSWVVFSANHKFLYAVNEIASYGPGKSGSVTAYAVDLKTGALKALNTVDSGGSIPCYISIDPSGKFALVANYTGGTFSVIRLKPDGSLGETTDIVKPEGPMTPYKAADRPIGMVGEATPHGSRAHMILPDPSGKYVIGADAGRNQIFTWKLDTGTGKLTQVSVAHLAEGVAPRHFAFSPDGKTMYLLQEQDSRLQVFGYADGKLTPKGASVSTLPAGFQGSNTTSELLIARDGRHLYAGNRNHDSIATVAVQPDGSVKLVATVPTGGSTPRSLTLSPDGKHLYSMNQRADNLTTFNIGADGVARPMGKYLAVGTPAVMVFLP